MDRRKLTCIGEREKNRCEWYHLKKSRHGPETGGSHLWLATALAFIEAIRESHAVYAPSCSLTHEAFWEDGHRFSWKYYQAGVSEFRQRIFQNSALLDHELSDLSTGLSAFVSNTLGAG